MADLQTMAAGAKSWPFAEAKRLAKRFRGHPPDKGHVLFQTGYGPSGLPHIGTFGEVVRTSMVRQAFETLTEIPTRLICFSDDMDGLRKVPENVPHRERLAEDIGLPLTRVRDPFGEYKSFAHHNNAMLRRFLDRFGFEYEFVSATETYRSGRFDEALLTALERFDQLMEIVLPTLGGVSADRRQTYSPFLPVSPKSGRVLQVPTLERNVSRGTIVYAEPDGERIEVPVTGGNVKLQWRPDWAMRWAALGVDYEMYGKDLIPSADLAKRLCRSFGRPPPTTMFYELFLNESGQKISKSKGGDGISIDEWLDYAPDSSLSYFMYQRPKAAKQLHFGVIPKAADEHERHLQRYWQGETPQLDNPVWHIHAGVPPHPGSGISYAMLLNLVSATGAVDPSVLWKYIQGYAPNASPESDPALDHMVNGSMRYFRRKLLPAREFRVPDDRERAALESLRDRLATWGGDALAEEYQKAVYEIGRELEFEPMRDWFRAIYEVLLGASQGPRFGGFIAMFGHLETARLIEDRLGSTFRLAAKE